MMVYEMKNIIIFTTLKLYVAQVGSIVEKS